jgi:hypothetical protein
LCLLAFPSLLQGVKPMVFWSSSICCCFIRVKYRF